MDRMSTIANRRDNEFVMLEFGIIFWYLAEKYQKFFSVGANARAEALQWLMLLDGWCWPNNGTGHVLLAHCCSEGDPG